jgi:hypothetical protein
MTALPAVGYFNGTITNANAKDAQDQTLAVIRELLGGYESTPTLTIATGAVTPVAAISYIDTEAAAAADDLDNIVQTNFPDGRLLLVSSVSNARVPTLRHGQGGAGQILLMDSANLALSNTTMWTLLKRKSTTWEEVFRGYGSNISGFRTYLGLGTAAIQNTGTASGVPLLTTHNVWGGQQGALSGTITNAGTTSGTVSWDVSTMQVASLLLNGSYTINDATNHKANHFYQMTIHQSASGSKSPSWGSGYNFIEQSAPTMPQTASARMDIFFKSDGTSLYEVGRALNNG